MLLSSMEKSYWLGICIKIIFYNTIDFQLEDND